MSSKYMHLMSGLRSTRRFKVLLFVALIYSVISMVYYQLPWPLRKPIRSASPKLDRLLCRSGYKLMNGWDSLGLVGKDCSIAANKKWQDTYAYGGYPSQGFQLFGRVNVLKNSGYVVGYSELMDNPLWVAYRVFDVPALSAGKRPGFRVDNRTRSKVSPKDYTHSGFDRGHMAPNYAIATRYGSAAQKETFLMSNIVPQTPFVNRNLWKDLEMLVAKRYGRYFSSIWVITGPIFKKPVHQLESGVAIPSAYYKVLVDVDNDKVRVMAFIMDRKEFPYTRLKKRLVSVDLIEEKTGLDFFSKLPREEQDALESKTPGRLWPWLIPSIKYHLNGETR